MSAEAQNQVRLAELRKGASSTYAGVVTDIDWVAGVATVNVGGTTQDMPWKGDAPWIGSTVRVDVQGLRPVCTPVWGHPLGTVVSTGSDLANVLGDDGVTYSYPYRFGDSYSGGERVALDHARKLVSARLSTDPALDTPVVPPPPTGGSGGVVSRTFTPNNSSNWWSTGGRWDGGLVEISVSRSGFYFYGTQIADTIPDSATVTSMTLALGENWDNVPGTPSKLGGHGWSVLPAGDPGSPVGPYIDVFGGGVVDITAFATSLKIGALFGVGFVQGFGWRQFGSSAFSGAITATWTT